MRASIRLTRDPVDKSFDLEFNESATLPKQLSLYIVELDDQKFVKSREFIGYIESTELIKLVKGI